MNKNDILKASRKLKDERLIIGELRDKKYMGEVLSIMSTVHPIEPLAHRKILFEVLSENPGKFGVSVDQVKEILSEVDKAKSRSSR